MSERKDGGPAFPVLVESFDGGATVRGLVTGNREGWHVGLSLRDYFAAAALTGEIASLSTQEAADATRGAMKASGETDHYRHVARVAYRMADAMIAARDRDTP